MTRAYEVLGYQALGLVTILVVIWFLYITKEQ